MKFEGEQNKIWQSKLEGQPKELMPTTVCLHTSVSLPTQPQYVAFPFLQILIISRLKHLQSCGLGSTVTEPCIFLNLNLPKAES